eukprot:2332964-Prymnesium_polylepis.1
MELPRVEPKTRRETSVLRAALAASLGALLLVMAFPAGGRRDSVVADCGTTYDVDAVDWAGLKADLKAYTATSDHLPILVRLSWHDSGTYKKAEDGNGHALGGGSAAAQRFPDGESQHGANAGLALARSMVQPYKEYALLRLQPKRYPAVESRVPEAIPSRAGPRRSKPEARAKPACPPRSRKYPEVSYADLWALAAITAIEAASGPSVPFRAGRVDIKTSASCVPEGRLPDGDKGASHIRSIFNR